MAANTPSEYCCHYAFIYIQFTFDSHLIHIRFSQFTVRIHRHPHNTPIPPMPPIPPMAPMAASATSSHRRASAHTRLLAGGHRHQSARTHFGRRPSLRVSHSHTLWPEAIAARWSCGPHVTPVSNRRRRCRAGVDDAHPQHGTSEMCRLCCNHSLLLTFHQVSQQPRLLFRYCSVHYR
jgi:hypothetical protein